VYSGNDLIFSYRLTAEGQKVTAKLGKDLTPRPLVFEEVLSFLEPEEEPEGSPPHSDDDESHTDKPVSIMPKASVNSLGQN